MFPVSIYLSNAIVLATELLDANNDPDIPSTDNSKPLQKKLSPKHPMN